MTSFDAALFTAVAAGMMRAATPVIYAGLGEIIYERSGVFNLGLEGLMLIGACTAVAAQLTWENWVVSVLVAALAAGAAGFVHAFFCVKLRTSQVATGLAFFFLCQGLTAVLGASLVGRPVVVDVSPPFAALRTIPILGGVLADQDVMVFGAIVAAVVVGILLFRTRWGIQLRACGEDAASASASGVAVHKWRLIAGAVGGMFSGLGGAHFALFYARQWQENMVAGRGWIALVMVIFGMWFPGRFLIGTYLFGGLTTLQLNLQARGVTTSQYLLAMVPFLVTLAMLVVASWRLKRHAGWMPADLGNPYPPELEKKV